MIYSHAKSHPYQDDNLMNLLTKWLDFTAANSRLPLHVSAVFTTSFIKAMTDLPKGGKLHGFH